VTVQEISVLFAVDVLDKLGMHDLLVEADNTIERSIIIREIPAFFERNRCIISSLVFCFFPLNFKASLRDVSWFYVLHVIDSDLLGDEVRLLQTSMIIIVDVSVNHTKLTSRKSEVCSEHNRFKGSQIDRLSFFKN